MTEPDDSPSTLPPHLVRRSAARLGAVQILFQLPGGKRTQHMIKDLSLQLLENRQGEDEEEGLAFEPDMAFLTQIVEGTVARLAEIDAHIAKRLQKDWKPERIDPVLRAVLRAGIYELLAEPETPAKVILNEYIDVAGAFAPKEETSFINGVLDVVARDVRPSEVHG